MFSQVMGVVPWNLPRRFGRGGQKYPPLEFVGGGRIPPGITSIITKSHICQFLMHSKDLYVDRQ